MMFILFIRFERTAWEEAGFSNETVVIFFTNIVSFDDKLRQQKQMKASHP